MMDIEATIRPWGLTGEAVARSPRSPQEDLRRRQEEHLERVRRNTRHGGMFEAPDPNKCAHNACSSCVGTGIKSDGTMCVHFISCPCPSCSFH